MNYGISPTQLPKSIFDNKWTWGCCAPRRYTLVMSWIVIPLESIFVILNCEPSRIYICDPYRLFFQACWAYQVYNKSYWLDIGRYRIESHLCCRSFSESFCPSIFVKKMVSIWPCSYQYSINLIFWMNDLLSSPDKWTVHVTDIYTSSVSQCWSYIPFWNVPK